MEFCPTCGTKLVIGLGEDGVALGLSCPQCNYKKPLTEVQSSTQKKESDLPRDGMVTVVSEKENLNGLPTVRFNCPKCSNDLAFQWRAQTQWTDESATQFYRCTECGHTSRD